MNRKNTFLSLSLAVLVMTSLSLITHAGYKVAKKDVAYNSSGGKWQAPVTNDAGVRSHWQDAGAVAKDAGVINVSAAKDDAVGIADVGTSKNDATYATNSSIKGSDHVNLSSVSAPPDVNKIAKDEPAISAIASTPPDTVLMATNITEKDNSLVSPTNSGSTTANKDESAIGYDVG